MGSVRTKVLFICGSGRSGSTLLDLLLGQADGVVSTGELRHVWERGFRQNQLCGCGSKFRDCGFWNRVVEEGFGGPESVNVGRMCDLAELLYAKHRVFRLMFPRLIGRYKGRLAAYTKALSALYDGISRASGCSVVVDSSKNPSHGFILSMLPNVDLYVLHLVRDSRAVAYSYTRKRVKPEVHWKQEYMRVHGPIDSAMRWTSVNGLSHMLRLARARYLRLRYEDLARDPRRAVSDVLKWLGVRGPAPDFGDGHSIHPGTHHMISGNPMKFQRGTIAVRPDSEWRRKSSTSCRLVATALTWPLLLEYHYL